MLTSNRPAAVRSTPMAALRSRISIPVESDSREACHGAMLPMLPKPAGDGMPRRATRAMSKVVPGSMCRLVSRGPWWRPVRYVPRLSEGLMGQADRLHPLGTCTATTTRTIHRITRLVGPLLL